MRALSMLLLLSACVPAGESAQLPAAQRELAFFVWVEAQTVTRVSAAFAIGPGEQQTPRPQVQRDTEALALVSLRLQDLRAQHPLLDEARLLEAELRVGRDAVCDERFADGRHLSIDNLPASAIIEPIEPPSSELELLRSQLQLVVPLADRACAPPFRVVHFAENGEAMSDGFLRDGQALTRGSPGADRFFSILDAQYLTEDEVVVVLNQGFFVLPRGGRRLAEEGPGYWDSSFPTFPWPDEANIDSAAVLPGHSDADRQRIVFIAGHAPENQRANTWVMTVDRVGDQLTVVGSTVTPGDPVRVRVDHAGRAVFGARLSEQERSSLLWTEDGVRFERRVVPYEVEGIAVTDDPAYPHITFRADIAELQLGDLSAPDEPMWPLGLDPRFQEGIRSVAGRRVGDALRVAVGGEEFTLRRLDIRNPRPSSSDWLPTSPIIDASTAAEACVGRPDECGAVPLPFEQDQLTLVAFDGGTWTLVFTKNCPHLIAIREDECTTHLRLDPIVPISTLRSMVSIRLAPDGGRALLAGHGGRLFELVVAPGGSVIDAGE